MSALRTGVIDSLWSVFKQPWDKGHVYKGYKVQSACLVVVMQIASGYFQQLWDKALVYKG